MEQVRGFLKAADRQARDERFRRALDARMTQADGKAWKAHVKGIRGVS